MPEPESVPPACEHDTYVVPRYGDETQGSWSLMVECNGGGAHACGFSEPYRDEDGELVPQYDFIGITSAEMSAVVERHQKHAADRHSRPGVQP